MGHYFGTDGFRGEANRVLTVEHAYKIGRYIGYLYSKEKSCRARAERVEVFRYEHRRNIDD